MRQNQYLATLTAAAALMFAVQARAAIIEVGTAQGEAGTTAVLTVSLNSEGAMVAGTQNDIAFPADAPIPVRATGGRPDCTALVKLDGSQFAFQPPGCTGAACTGIRAIIISFNDLEPIPDGSDLYTCNVAIASTATGTLPLTCSGAGASDPVGGAITSTCTNGSVMVGPPVVGTPTATPTEVAGGTTIHVGSVTGNVGQADLTFTTSLETDALVAGTQNDITFSGGLGAAITIPAKATGGRPDCTALVKTDGSQFAFQPPGCTGETCTGIRAIIISFNDLEPIPTGTDLYTCKITINSGEDGDTFPLSCSGEGASDPDGGALPTSCTDGEVTIGGGDTPTPTASPTATTSVVGTATITPTGGATATRTVSVVPTAPFTTCDDSCAITSPADAQTGWLLLLPAAMLIWLRRRSR